MTKPNLIDLDTCQINGMGIGDLFSKMKMFGNAVETELGAIYQADGIEVVCMDNNIVYIKAYNSGVKPSILQMLGDLDSEMKMELFQGKIQIDGKEYCNDFFCQIEELLSKSGVHKLEESLRNYRKYKVIQVGERTISISISNNEVSSVEIS